jgi:LuxR family maltose regulon positive regulatory protein
VGIAELALSDRETGALIRGAGVTLPPARVTEIAADTEGWPTGIYVAALAHTERADARASDLLPADDDRLALDFIRTEVLDGLKPNLLRFLTRTAVLDRMSGPLCDAILDSTGSTARLRTLEASGLFVVALDHERTWYRYHRQFRDALRSELVRIDDTAVAEIHRRAADWFEADGQDDAAVEASRASGDPDHLARLVGRLTLGSEARLGRVGLWLDAFDDEDAMLERSAPVAIFGTFFHATAGRPETAERWARVAERLHDQGPMPDGSPSSVAWLAVLRAAMVRDGVEAMGADAEVGLALVARASPWRARALLLAGVADLLAGRPDEADRHLAEVVDEIRPERVSMTAAAALAERAVTAIAVSDWAAADVHVQRSLALITEDHLEEAPISALTYALAARLAIRRGDPDSGELAFGRAQRARPLLTYALPWLAVQVRLQLAHAYLAIAESSAVRTLLAEIEDIFRHRPAMGLLVDEAAEIARRVGDLRDGTPGAWTLTTAELRLLPYLPTHLSFREIAARLCISLNTVKTQAISVYGKLGASSRGGAIERAVQVGLLDPSAATLPGERVRS